MYCTNIYMNNLISISDARSILPSLVAQINEKLDRAVITVNGQPKAVVMSFDELESLEETAEVLSLPHIKSDIKKSRSEIKKGQYTSLKDLK
jgi:antitoxin YefM